MGNSKWSKKWTQAPNVKEILEIDKRKKIIYYKYEDGKLAKLDLKKLDLTGKDRRFVYRNIHLAQAIGGIAFENEKYDVFLSKNVLSKNEDILNYDDIYFLLKKLKPSIKKLLKSIAAVF